MMLTGARLCEFCSRRERAYLIRARGDVPNAILVFQRSACPECAGLAEAWGVRTPEGLPLLITHVLEIPIGAR